MKKCWSSWKVRFSGWLVMVHGCDGNRKVEPPRKAQWIRKIFKRGRMCDQVVEGW